MPRRVWIRWILLALASGGVGAALTFVSLRYPVHLESRRTVDQIIGPRTEQDKACEKLGHNVREQHVVFRYPYDDYGRIDDFYSERLEGCVQAGEALTDNLFEVVEGGIGGRTLFVCDPMGTLTLTPESESSSPIESKRRMTRKDCEKLFLKELEDLR